MDKLGRALCPARLLILYQKEKHFVKSEITFTGRVLVGAVHCASLNCNGRHHCRPYAICQSN